MGIKDEMSEAFGRTTATMENLPTKTQTELAVFGWVLIGYVVTTGGYFTFKIAKALANRSK